MLSAKKLELRGTVLVSERREENAALNETALSRVERYRCVLHRVRALEIAMRFFQGYSFHLQYL